MMGWTIGCGGCVPPYGLVVAPLGCGCDCADGEQTGIKHGLCNCTITIKVGSDVIATCTSTAPPCTPCKFLGLADGDYTIIVEHDNYETSTDTYTFTRSLVADVWFTPQLCEETGKHCLSLCGDPGPVTGPLTLTIVDSLAFYMTAGATGGITDFQINGPVSITWQPTPIPGASGSGWWGQTTGTAVVGTVNPVCATNCDPYDCDCIDFAEEDVDVWINLRCSTDSRLWELWIYGPESAACYTDSGSGCANAQGFLLDTAVYTLWSPVSITCPTTTILGVIPEAPTHTCDPLELDFIQSRDGGSTWTVWGTLTA